MTTPEFLESKGLLEPGFNDLKLKHPSAGEISLAGLLNEWTENVLQKPCMLLEQAEEILNADYFIHDMDSEKVRDKIKRFNYNQKRINEGKGRISPLTKLPKDQSP